MRRLVPVGLALVAGLVASPVFAQEGPAEIARREFIAQAQEAATSGDHARALEFATRAGRLRMTTTLRMLIAQEHNALGHTVDALDFAIRCAHEAEAATTLNDRDRVLEVCTTLVTTLRNRVGRVTVRVPSPAPTGLRVRVQGTEMDAALWGVPYPVLPGPIVIEATASDGATFRRELRVEAGATSDVHVALTAAARAVRPPGAVTAARPLRPGPFIVAGAGVALLAASAGFFAARDGAVSERDASAATTSMACNLDPARCDYSAARAADDRARTFTVLTQVSVAVGAAAVAGGVVWFLLSRSRTESPRTALNFGVSPIMGGAIMGLGGAL